MTRRHQRFGSSVSEAPGATQVPTSGARRGWVGTAIPGVALFAVYWALSLINDPRGFLSPDSGGKVATLKTMAASGTFTNVDVGYWAQQWDPSGSLHPLYNTVSAGPHWIQVSTLPMLLLGEPLYRIGGYRATLLLPILGGVACAYAARSLARRIGADHRTAWWAFWITGCASPVTIYALDFWEHTIGLALITWGVIALIDLVEETTPLRRIVLGGLGGCAFGVAATMRTEALVYLAVSLAVIGVVALHRTRSITRWIGPGIAVVVGVLVPWGLNRMLNQWVFGYPLRDGRVSSVVTGSGFDLVGRARDGLYVTFAMTGGEAAVTIATGIIVAMMIVALARVGDASRKDPTPLVAGALVVGVGSMYLAVFAAGPGWMPGIVGAAPLAAVGVAVAWRPSLTRSARVAATIALLALPVVWLFQWSGIQILQWGGQYQQPTMLILLVIGAVGLAHLRRPVAVGFTVLSAAVTVFGLTWFSVHTHEVADTFTNLSKRSEPVFIADGQLLYLPREGGAFYGDQRWLVAPPGTTTRLRAANVVEDAGFSDFGLVHLAGSRPPKSIGNFSSTGSTRVGTYQGAPVDVTSYVQDLFGTTSRPGAGTNSSAGQAENTDQAASAPG